MHEKKLSGLTRPTTAKASSRFNSRRVAHFVAMRVEMANADTTRRNQDIIAVVEPSPGTGWLGKAIVADCSVLRWKLEEGGYDR